MKLSILISSFKRLEYIRRTLYSIAYRPPECEFEVVVADEISDESENILRELRSYDDRFSWKLISCDISILEKYINKLKFFNNPSWTNNIAFKNSSGDYLCLMGNDIIVTDEALREMVKYADSLKEHNQYFTIYSTTYDCSKLALEFIGSYGVHLTKKVVEYCKQWPLQTPSMKGMVTNYCSLTNRATWLMTKGYDENYVFTHACEDSDWAMRARTLPSYKDIYLNHAITLHQNHDGRTPYQLQNQKIITNDKWDEGLKAGREYLAQWDGKTPTNRQSWPFGEIGITNIIKNEYR